MAHGMWFSYRPLSSRIWKVVEAERAGMHRLALFCGLGGTDPAMGFLLSMEFFAQRRHFPSPLSLTRRMSSFELRDGPYGYINGRIVGRRIIPYFFVTRRCDGQDMSWVLGG